MSAETGFFRGEGGAIFEMALPLTGHAATQAEAGRLTRVAGPDGGEWNEPAGGAGPADEPPAEAAVKAFWVSWAVHSGMPEAEAASMTKAQLVEQFGGTQ